MALPPWLNISPFEYLRAVEAGTQAGLSIREANERAFENAQRMEMERERQQEALKQQAIENAQTRLAQERLEAYRQGQLKNAQESIGVRDLAQQVAEGRLGELERHNRATEDRATEKGQARITTLPDAPGYTFLKNPSGALTPLNRPTKDIPEGEKMRLKIEAQKMFNLGNNELPTDPSYQSRTNLAGGILNELNSSKPSTKKRVKVKGPNGQTGTIEEGDTLPDGWTQQQ